MSSDQNDFAAGSQDAPRFASPGEALRDARLQHGLDATQVAEALRLSPKTLEYIETGQFDRLPGDTFGRGYIRAYARLLKLDPTPYVLAYDRQMGIQERERPVHGISQVAPYTQSSRLWVRGTTAALMLAVVGCGVWWWSADQRPQQAQLASSPDGLLEDVQIDSLPPPVPIPGMQRANLSLIERPESGADLASYSAPGGAAEQADTATEQRAVSASNTAAAPTPPAAVEPQPATATATSTSDGRNLQMSFSDNCWVQISTMEGRVVHSGLMQAGQSITIPQQGPLQVVIGAVEAVESIQLAGAPVQLPSHKQSGVVRLRLDERG
ncbi:cytoskeleton protein RodZ [Halopseudomonas xinjiangensis]|uniref:Cytoskeleton protein RodZ n=1 Tax=Halopseudomonas xinjiangensis TaxID=487184 RepID=A0A1H1LLU7_9GAMM|nr:RodZ domain-containing protein [Halopseudomonas xinjiangensis]SDR74839.1 cytoskeleton protein RodZ [Halopseudomonas xinjiangensis]